jgi:hypothetical protein
MFSPSHFSTAVPSPLHMIAHSSCSRRTPKHLPSPTHFPTLPRPCPLTFLRRGSIASSHRCPFELFSPNAKSLLQPTHLSTPP